MSGEERVAKIVCTYTYTYELEETPPITVEQAEEDAEYIRDHVAPSDLEVDYTLYNSKGQVIETGRRIAGVEMG